MWLLFHRNKKTRPVPDGERFVETCPSCKVRGTFVEVELEENLGLFFVDLVGDKQRAFRCSSCAETFEHKDDGDAVEEKSPQQLERERREAEQQRLVATKLAEKQRLLEDEKRREAVEQKAVRIEDELAALKARLGKR